METEESRAAGAFDKPNHGKDKGEDKDKSHGEKHKSSDNTKDKPSDGTKDKPSDGTKDVIKDKHRDNGKPRHKSHKHKSKSKHSNRSSKPDKDRGSKRKRSEHVEMSEKRRDKLPACRAPTPEPTLPPTDWDDGTWLCGVPPEITHKLMRMVSQYSPSQHIEGKRRRSSNSKSEGSRKSHVSRVPREPIGEAVPVLPATPVIISPTPPTSIAPPRAAPPAINVPCLAPVTLTPAPASATRALPPPPRDSALAPPTPAPRHGPWDSESQSQLEPEPEHEPEPEDPGNDDDSDFIQLIKFEVDENGDIMRPATPEYDELDSSDDEKPEIEVIVISDDDGPVRKQPRAGPSGRRGRTRAVHPNYQASTLPTHARSNPTHQIPVRTRTERYWKRWTAKELLDLHAAALTDAPNRFANAVPGRTARQCESTWRNTIYPAIVKMLEERGRG
ncbi:hypothetical protein CcaverHIS002_0702760 [Cutaneotrichosporon cavernicola]|uniref:Myb-like domain-containing protein n=1 Tax=Cutaneotrichosporon cavernicola TaxID=279322 RepID=A0AA48L9Z4_9TREE|nr:uncharacterized protein CcaverHIS019_0702840 [Cutaneotrichosporon cavernicola]BEI86930.1 hypothetical protein CcaverHIS002_0702760 [Cutaneotrichosporon cavernicola]BEI94703.1 hypothetical protein CcaverHIS019_0702840 [Cutaneotrichosporon cavernicola]BEJ02478.1 hypothetical protein CcaverHIS631_0702730 [Cutaneotrichosporon cavernicola]BEJ10236.1 hypothetical protein CcaverHIS641_0702710 [Cutaneotrichosporon cavernicola]